MGYGHGPTALRAMGYYNKEKLKSVQNESRKILLAKFYDRVQPRTPKASKRSVLRGALAPCS